MNKYIFYAKVHEMFKWELFRKKRPLTQKWLNGSVTCALWLKKHGIQKGDKVGIWTDNHLDTYAPVFACCTLLR